MTFKEINDGLSLYIKDKEEIKFSEDIQDAFHKGIVGRSAALELWARQLLYKINLKPEDAEKLIYYIDDKSEPLTPELKQLYDDTITPLIKKSNEIYNDMKGISNSLDLVFGHLGQYFSKCMLKIKNPAFRAGFFIRLIEIISG